MMLRDGESIILLKGRLKSVPKPILRDDRSFMCIVQVCCTAARTEPPVAVEKDAVLTAEVASPLQWQLYASAGKGDRVLVTGYLSCGNRIRDAAIYRMSWLRAST